jgi:hypothetical protein
VLATDKPHTLQALDAPCAGGGLGSAGPVSPSAWPGPGLRLTTAVPVDINVVSSSGGESESEFAAMSAVAAWAQWLWDNPLTVVPSRHAAAAAADVVSDWRRGSAGEESAEMGALADPAGAVPEAAGGNYADSDEEARLVDRLWAAGWAGRRARVSNDRCSP